MKIEGMNNGSHLVQQAIADGRILIIDDPGGPPANPEALERWRQVMKERLSDDGPVLCIRSRVSAEDDLAGEMLRASTPETDLHIEFAEAVASDRRPTLFVGESSANEVLQSLSRAVEAEAIRRFEAQVVSKGAPLPTDEGGFFRPNLKPNRKQRRAEAAIKRGGKP